MISTSDQEEVKRQLLEQIREEERLIRIYEADLKLTQQSRQQLPNLEEDDDWLANTLDALQSLGGSIEFNCLWHDDPRLFKLLPFVSGIVFDSVKSTSKTSFEFQARTFQTVIVRLNVRVSVDFTSTPQVISIEVEFGDENEELREIAATATQTRNLVLLFRQTVQWARFEARRSTLLQNYPSIERPCKHILRIRFNDTDYCEIIWKFRQGYDQLELGDCQVDSQPTAAMTAVEQSEGFKHLLTCTNGSCEGALRILFEAMGVPNVT